MDGNTVFKRPYATVSHWDFCGAGQRLVASQTTAGVQLARCANPRRPAVDYLSVDAMRLAAPAATSSHDSVKLSADTGTRLPERRITESMEGTAVW